MAKKLLSTSATNKKRIIFFFAVVCLLLMALLLRLGWLQIVNADKYADLATEQQTRDLPVSAKRGVIYDRNGNELATSAVAYNVWVRPADVRAAEEKEPGFTDDMAEVLADILAGTSVTSDVTVTDEAVASKVSSSNAKTAEEIKAIITDEDSSLLKVAKFVDKNTADAIRAAFKEGTVQGVQIAADVKRYYPKGSFAAHLLGSTTDDNSGMSGLELQYDSYLSGVPGRWIKSTDVSGRNLTYGVEKYYQAEDGLDIVLTVDQTIQYYVEKAIDQVQATTNAERVMALVMDPETAEILAMAVTPDFDPNDPRTPLAEGSAEYVKSLSDEEKINYWNEMWRNPIVNDTYEPGSTFKLITTSIALEEGVTNINESFYCSGYYTVAGQTLKCWRSYNPHGAETLAQAIQNSCNPVQVELSQRIGITKYYEYLDAFGISGKTGIDLPGEATPILQSEDTAGPVGLATISYGQGIAVTPIELLTAICAIGNEGVLMQPHVVEYLKDSDGNVIQKYEPTVIRQVLSKETSSDMCKIMQSVVESGTGGAAYLPGFRVGGKTGTANKVENGKYTSETYSSFVAMAPMDDPQVAVLVIVDSPQGVHFGSQTAGPGVNSILEATLRYMNVEPVYTDAELASLSKNAVNVPDLTGQSSSKAKSTLAKLGLEVVISPAYQAGEAESEFNVVDQYPKYGSTIEKGDTVCLYRK